MTTNTVINSNTSVVRCKAITFGKGTGTEASNAVTINAQCGVITTSSLSIGSPGGYSITLTNSHLTSSSVCILSWMGGTNTSTPFWIDLTASTGVIQIHNTSGSTLSGTIIIGFAIF